ncbi:MAG: hypothetical protein Q7U55_01745 [Deltaproteobacteria bacterium]|nr:hypothetical protein [Deltaproteobacteria bacterium]
MHEKKPWLKFYGQIPEHIDYPRVTMYEALMQTVSRSPDAVAYVTTATTSFTDFTARTSFTIAL